MWCNLLYAASLSFFIIIIIIFSKCTWVKLNIKNIHFIHTPETYTTHRSAGGFKRKLLVSWYYSFTCAGISFWGNKSWIHTFIHLVDTFIQSDKVYWFYQFVCSLWSNVYLVVFWASEFTFLFISSILYSCCKQLRWMISSKWFYFASSIV